MKKPIFFNIFFVVLIVMLLVSWGVAALDDDDAASGPDLLPAIWWFGYFSPPAFRFSQRLVDFPRPVLGKAAIYYLKLHEKSPPHFELSLSEQSNLIKV